MTQVEDLHDLGAIADEIRELWIGTALDLGHDIPMPTYSEDFRVQEIEIRRCAGVLFEGVHQRSESIMVRATVETNERLQIRMAPAHKTRIVRAAAIKGMDLTQFVTQTMLREANDVIAQDEQITITEREAAFLMDLLENPPALNDKMRAAIASLAENQ